MVNNCNIYIKNTKYVPHAVNLLQMYVELCDIDKYNLNNTSIETTLRGTGRSLIPIITIQNVDDQSLSIKCTVSGDNDLLIETGVKYLLHTLIHANLHIINVSYE